MFSSWNSGRQTESHKLDAEGVATWQRGVRHFMLPVHEQQQSDSKMPKVKRERAANEDMTPLSKPGIRSTAAPANATF